MKTLKEFRFSRSTSVAIMLAAAATSLLGSSDALFGSTGAVVQSAQAVVGLGWLEGISCVACIAAFLIGSGTTLAGLAVFLAANPEIAILCVANCEAAAK